MNTDIKTDIKDVECFLLDMDGTIYLGNDLIDGAKEFLEELEYRNKRYIFMTNNSSKSKKNYVQKLEKLGIHCNIDNIFTSGEATAIYLTEQMKNPKIFLLGTKELEEEFLNHKIDVVNEKNERPDFVVLGFDTTLTYDKLWKACDYIREGVAYIATHPDFNCPLEDGKYMPDTGSMIKMIEASTQKLPNVIGKPNKGIIEAICKKFNIDKSSMAMVGDRLYTDVKLGINAGITSVLVLSGETNIKDLEQSDVYPTYVFNSVKDIYVNIKGAEELV